MSEKPDNGADEHAQWQAQVEAQGFRARGESVYPGRLLVLRDGSFAVHPVDDAAFDPATERILGIAIWGACSDWELGMVRVEEGPSEKSAPLIAGEGNRPSTFLGRLDAWIARADALRQLRRGSVVAYPKIPLTHCRQLASVVEVERSVRESAIALVQNAPRDQRDALLALARVADVEHPQDKELTDAIVELTASAPAWMAQMTANPLAKRVASRVNGSGDNGDAKPSDLPAGAEAIDEHDAALLAFLNRNPSLRRKVSDVLPDTGPQNRGAIGKRLRKLADRNPPLVDYPKPTTGKRANGVAILPAGIDTLKRLQSANATPTARH